MVIKRVIFFQAGVDCFGKIQYLNLDNYEDHGYKINEQFNLLGLGVYNNAYDNSRWNFRTFSSTTDTAKNTWARAPGSLKIIIIDSYIHQHIFFQ